MLMSIPVPLVGGLLVFIGLVLLDDWLMRSFGVLPWTEYAIVLLMFVTIVGFGFLRGGGHRNDGHHGVLRRPPQPRGVD